MSENVKPIPDGYEGITPYLICRNAEAAIEFYKRAFGAVELFRIGQPPAAPADRTQSHGCRSTGGRDTFD